MKLNRFFPLPCDPFISHMRIAYEDGIRKQTEEHWRGKIAGEVLRKFPHTPNVEIIAKEIRENYEG